MLEEEGSELQYTTEKKWMNLMLPLSRPQSWLEYPNVSFSATGSSELVIADFAVNNGATTSVQSTNNLT